MVHRKVDYEAAVGTNDATVLPLIAEQFAADRAATSQIYAAIQALAKAVNGHDGELRDHNRRLDEQVRLRFDDNKLHNGAVLHVRTGVEAMEQAIREQGKQSFEALAAILDEAIPQLVGEKLVAAKRALDELKGTEKVMKEYLQELSTQRPEEGRMVFAQFHAMRGEVDAIKATQQQQPRPPQA